MHGTTNTKFHKNIAGGNPEQIRNVICRYKTLAPHSIRCWYTSALQHQSDCCILRFHFEQKLTKKNWHTQQLRRHQITAHIYWLPAKKKIG